MGSRNRPPLSSREATVLADLERNERSVVTLAELAQTLGKPAAYATVRSLVAKGTLTRVARGVYEVRPFRQHGRPWSTSAVVAATHMLAGQPHYLGGWWAWTVHHLTSQTHASRLDAFVTKWRPEKQLGHATLRFHRIAPEKLEWGLVTTTVEGAAIRVSNRERSLLDALDHPPLIGALPQALQLVIAQLPSASKTRLVAHAVHGSRMSTCQRVGLLLERLGTSNSTLRPLRSRVREAPSTTSLWPNRRREGRIHPDWRVVENDAAAEA
jgi:predicted transcriptional regulator of viral defense system